MRSKEMRGEELEGDEGMRGENNRNERRWREGERKAIRMHGKLNEKAGGMRGGDRRVTRWE